MQPRTQTAAKLAARPDPVEVFAGRAAARAYLWAEFEIADLGEAVDVLQADAVRTGLVAQLGQDEVQRLMATAFRGVHGRAAIAIVSESNPEPTVWRGKPRSHRAVQSTVEALMFSLRERGGAALAERDSQRRLAELSSAQVREVLARLIKLRPRYPAITDEMLFQLDEQLA